MASPSTVISRGYGSWGSVNLLPTLGYGIGAGSIVAPCWTSGEVYTLGFQKAEVFSPGFQDADVFHVGFQQGERGC